MDIRRTECSLQGLTNHDIDQALIESLLSFQGSKVLLIPPDITRYHSKAGYITNRYYHLLKDIATVDILPALGTHVPMTAEELNDFFGDVPLDCFLIHDWRNDVISIGEVPASFVSEITEGLWKQPVVCEINQLILNGGYDLILSIGQVVPHEVIGMANHSKNILVGCGGKQTINGSHMIGAVYGMERMMGKDHTPVRQILDYAMEHFLSHLPIVFVLTVTTAKQEEVFTHGLFIGESRSTFEAAVQLSQERNIDFVERPIQTCVVYLDPREFKSTWLGNKAVYRTRMAIQDGGELIVLAPGVTRFGEDETIDRLIRKYGYIGRDNILKQFHQETDLQNNMSAAAHLIHGSSDGRFTVTYAVKHLSQAEVEDVNFQYADYDQMIQYYNPKNLSYGFNTLPDGKDIYFIPNPALGLWMDKSKF